MGKRLIIIDSNSVIHRAFHALPPLTNKKGEVVNAVYGFLLVFLKAVKDFNPDFIAACFDFPAPTFRHKKFKKYKAKRAAAPEELYSQIPKVKKVLKSFGVPVFEAKGFEGDDVIGTISRSFSEKQLLLKPESIILSGDLDVLQLVNKNTKVYNLKKGVKNTILYDEQAVEEKYGFPPDKIVDFKALRGDPSDNIPGALGIGEKGAFTLIKKFGSINNLYNKIETVDQKIREKLLKSKDQVLLSRELAKIDTNVPVSFNFKKCRWKNNKKEVIKVLEELGFQSLIKRFLDLQKEQKKGIIEKEAIVYQKTLF